MVDGPIPPSVISAMVWVSGALAPCMAVGALWVVGALPPYVHWASLAGHYWWWKLANDSLHDYAWTACQVVGDRL